MKAREMVYDSKQVYACGFSFSGPNVRMLGLDKIGDPHFSKKIVAANYDGNLGLKHQLQNLERDITVGTSLQFDELLGKDVKISRVTVEVISGTRSEPMPADVWFSIGSVGEMPG